MRGFIVGICLVRGDGDQTSHQLYIRGWRRALVQLKIKFDSRFCWSMFHFSHLIFPRVARQRLQVLVGSQICFSGLRLLPSLFQVGLEGFKSLRN